MDSAVEDILVFWFGSTDLTALAGDEKQQMWWQGGAVLDGTIQERFDALLADAGAGRLDGWCSTLAGRLALIILLDQFSRNIHRGTPGAFAMDPRAQALCLEALDQGLEQHLGLHQRTFLLMPLEHAEDLSRQQRCMAEFARLAAEVPEEQVGMATYLIGFAQKHYDIIARFGRFPHRNGFLGRTHTPGEAAWLAEGGESFSSKG